MFRSLYGHISVFVDVAAVFILEWVDSMSSPYVSTHSYHWFERKNLNNILAINKKNYIGFQLIERYLKITTSTTTTNWTTHRRTTDAYTESNTHTHTSASNSSNFCVPLFVECISYLSLLFCYLNFFMFCYVCVVDPYFSNGGSLNDFH